ncbi:MAG: zf-HC2 domain-containing protein [Phycisphaerales bacterium]
MIRAPILWYILTASCDEAARLTSLSMERELEPSEWWALHGHTAICGGCRRFARNLQMLRDTLRSASTITEQAGAGDGAATLDADARARILRAIRTSSSGNDQDR